MTPCLRHCFVICLANFGLSALGHSDYVEPPPLYSIEAVSLYDAGFQHGRLASDKIRVWLADDEMVSILEFVRGRGQSDFEELKRINTKAFPQYVEEMRGIADGAGVELDAIWADNLIMELESLMTEKKKATHCSDFYSVDEFVHGHNEDWGTPANKLYYYVKYTALNGANFSSCAGLSFPGVIVGWSPAWNEHGIYLAQNSLYPRGAISKGLGCAFAQREAVCGKSGSQGLDAVIKSLTSGYWADGASVNLVSLRERRQVNVEMALGKHSVLEVTAALGNYSHFNDYKHSGSHVGSADASSIHRQARADTLPPPRSVEDVKGLLSDTADLAYPIFRNVTLASIVLDKFGNMDTWCCGNAPKSTMPCHSWNIFNFFEQPKLFM